MEPWDKACEGVTPTSVPTFGSAIVIQQLTFNHVGALQGIHGVKCKLLHVTTVPEDPDLLDTSFLLPYWTIP